MGSEVSPVGDPACPPLSVQALCRESAASVPARELLGERETANQIQAEGRKRFGYISKKKHKVKEE